MHGTTRIYGRKGLVRGMFLPLLLFGACLVCFAMDRPAQAASFNNSPLLGKQSQIARQDAQIEKDRQAPAAGPENADKEKSGRLSPETAAVLAGKDQGWRIRFLEAAASSGPMLTLGEVAVPAGNMPARLWAELAALELWPAPGPGRSVNITRPRLQQNIVDSLGSDFARLCLYPASLTVQAGGCALEQREVMDIVVKSLTPLLATLPGEAEFKDFRLPARIFLDHPGQSLALEIPDKITPGRMSLRLAVREADGVIARRLSGTVWVDVWATVPAASLPVNKGDVLRPEQITFVRRNLASLREQPWDGKGGPWRAARPLAPDQPILQSDLGHVPTVLKGQHLTLVYENSGVRLAVLAEALADGVTGEDIPVRNAQSKRQVLARILDRSTVLVSRPGRANAARGDNAGEAKTVF